MSPRLKLSITSGTLLRLQQVKGPAQGSLFGHYFENSLVIAGFSIDTSSEGGQSFHKLQPEVIEKLPNEIDYCGAVLFDTKLDENQLLQYATGMTQDVDVTDNPVLLTMSEKSIQAHILINGKLEKISYDTLTSLQFSTNFMHLRLKGEIPLSCENSPDAVREAFESLRKKVVSNRLAFQCSGANLFLSGEEDGEGLKNGVTSKHMVKDLLDSPGTGGKNDSTNKTEMLLFNLFIKQTVNSASSTVMAPFIHHVKRNLKGLQMFLQLDGISLIHRNTKVSNLYDILVNSFYRSLKSLEDNLINQLEGGPGNVSVPETFYFLPPDFNHFISATYSKGSNDSVLRPTREFLHKSFGIPLDRPVFRRSLKHIFSEEKDKQGPLINPHEGLVSGVKEGEVSLVKGFYEYYHYMQQNFDDNGWGCAYRSLQTIVSWFRQQGYTDCDIPSHKAIQECLVKIGDKPSSFIGSKKWIGSTEVSFVLETLIGVQCRILTASTGEEVATLGSDLSYHFQTSGSPVMIGGGVLAHTIIGVDYNRTTGEIKFLILDPHYTGSDDLRTITNKGWVGWKDTKFWAKNAFYNLCLPLRGIGDI